jgi:hypothetical protein
MPLVGGQGASAGAGLWVFAMGLSFLQGELALDDAAPGVVKVHTDDSVCGHAKPPTLYKRPLRPL